jgi:hypothetical protein
VIDGERIYSKLETGKFPDEQSIIAAVGERLKKAPALAVKK